MLGIAMRQYAGMVNSLQVKAGHQVAYLKAWLHQTEGLEPNAVRLMYDGKEMIDPLSLMDYPQIEASKQCNVLVQMK
jgi:hypothetical protein